MMDLRVLLLLALGVCSLVSENVEYDVSEIFVPPIRNPRVAESNITRTEKLRECAISKRGIAEDLKGILTGPLNGSTSDAPETGTEVTLDKYPGTTVVVDKATTVPQNNSTAEATNNTHWIPLNHGNETTGLPRKLDSHHLCPHHIHHVKNITTHHIQNGTDGNITNITTEQKSVHLNHTHDPTSYTANGTVEYSKNISIHHDFGHHNDSKGAEGPEAEHIPESEGLWPLLILSMPVLVIATSLVYYRLAQLARDIMATRRRRPFLRFIERILRRDSNTNNSPNGNLLQLKEIEGDEEFTI